MGTFTDWFLGNSETVEDRSLTRESLPESFFPESAIGEPVSTKGAMRIADVFACVRVLAHSAAACPFQVFERTADGSREQIENATAELLDEPAPGVTQPTFVIEAMSSLALWGEVFIAKWRGPDGAVVQLGVLPPDQVKVELVSGEPRFTYTARDGHINENLTLDDLIHVRGVTLDGVRGASPVALCREAFGLAKSLTESSAALWANGGKPTGLLKVPSGNQGEEQAANLARGWEARHGGPKSAGRVAVVTGDIGWESVSMSMADAEWIATRNLSKQDIAAIMGVQPWLVGAPTGDSLTYSTVAMQAEAHVRFDLMPRLRLIEAAVSQDADLCPGPEYVRFNVDALLRSDAATRFGIYKTGIEIGVLSVDEARALEDLPTNQRGESEETSRG